MTHITYIFYLEGERHQDRLELVIKFKTFEKIFGCTVINIYFDFKVKRSQTKINLIKILRREKKRKHAGESF